jgi:hypothetical protein
MIKASFVFYYAYLPVISRQHWDVLEVADNPDEKVRIKVLDETISTIAANETAAGIIGSIVCFLFAAVILYTTQTLPMSSGWGVSGFSDAKGIETYR